MLPAYWQNGARCSTVVKVPGSFWERHHGDWIICHKSGPSSHSLVKFHANTVLYSGITQEHYRVQISTVIYSVTT